MTIKTTVKLHGFGELANLLKRLPREVQAVVATKAVKAGAETLLDKARLEVPIGKTSGPNSRYGNSGHAPGTLRQSLYAFPLRSNSGSKTVRYAVGTNAARYQGEAFYGPFLEFGHRLGKRKLRKRIKLAAIDTGKGGRKKSIYQINDTRKEVPANPFLERAWKAGRGAALNRILEVTRRELIARAKALGNVGK